MPPPCKAVTKTGQPCKLAPKGSHGFCWRHLKESEGGEAEENTTEIDEVSLAGAEDAAEQPETTAEKEPEPTAEKEEKSATTTATSESNPSFKFDFSSMEVPREPAIPASTNPNEIPSFKIVIAGDGAVGKSAFVDRWVNGGFLTQYEPTIGTTRSEVVLNTNVAPVKFDLWDLAGQEKYGGLRDGYYIGAQAAILCFDVTNRTSYKNIPIWHKDICRVCESIPIVLLGMKADVGQRQGYDNDAKGDNATRTVMPSHITFHRKKNLQYYEVSSKTLLNIDKPFTWLLQKLTSDPKMSFSHNFNMPADPSDEKGEAVNVHTPGGTSSELPPPSPFEARFGANPTALSFEPAEKLDFNFTTPFSFGDAAPVEFSSPFTMPKLQSPSTFSFDNPFNSASASSSATPGAKDEVGSLTAKFAGAAISGDMKSEAAVQRAALLQDVSLQEFLTQEFDEGDDEGDPDYDPNLDEGDEDYDDWEGDEGDEGEEEEPEEGGEGDER